MEELYKRAAELAGRDVEVETTKDGKHIVLYMVFNQSPPPKGNSERDALEKFIEWAEKQPPKVLPEVDLPVSDESEIE
jgi:hypothetical protein